LRHHTLVYIAIQDCRVQTLADITANLGAVIS